MFACVSASEFINVGCRIVSSDAGESKFVTTSGRVVWMRYGLRCTTSVSSVVCSCAWDILTNFYLFIRKCTDEIGQLNIIRTFPLIYYFHVPSANEK